jgi:hypothetical protein
MGTSARRSQGYRPSLRIETSVPWIVPCPLRKAAYCLAVRFYWEGRDRPEQMRADGRPPYQDFEPSEVLSFRWFSTDCEADGSIRRNNLPVPNQSVNRSKHGGRAWHVLIPEPWPDDVRTKRNLCMGIVQMSVAGVPDDYGENGASYQFVVEHDPMNHNYCHCEIRVYKNGRRLTKEELKKAKGAKKHYRDGVYKAAKTILRPEVATAGNSG